MTPDEVLALFRECSALLDGHFRLSSGLHSPGYLQCALVLQHPAHAAALGGMIAGRVRALMPGVVLSPALGGVIIGHEVARALGVRALFAEREGTALTLRRGFRLSAGERVVVVEDVITTGRSTLETMEVARAAGGVVVAATAIVNRSGGRAALGVPVLALADLLLPTYQPDECPLCRVGCRTDEARVAARHIRRPVVVESDTASGLELGAEHRHAGTDRRCGGRPSRVLKLTLAYDGTGFVGWQRQAAGASIQGLIEQAFAAIEGRRVTVTGAGRTDAGVHALGQVASAPCTSSLEPNTLRRALNAMLPPEVRILAVEDAAPGFHARRDARLKTYRYCLSSDEVVSPFEHRYVWHVPQPLDVDLMEQAARAVEGRHDFAGFQAAGSTVGTTVRTVFSSTVRRARDEDLFWPPGARPAAYGASPRRLLIYDVSGDGFLRHMVRTIVGTLVDIGSRRREVRAIEDVLASRQRQTAGPTAPASGLCLVRVTFGP